MQIKYALLITLFLAASNALAEEVASTESANTKSIESTGLSDIPAVIGNLYSDVDMRVRLATQANLDACIAEQCVANAAFDKKVALLSTALTKNAYVIYPDLKKRVPEFSISVIDKKEAGMASNAGGKIVVFRGLQQLMAQPLGAQQLVLTDDTLAFLIAREMGHVIAKHHDKNTTTKIVFSVLAGVLFPAVALISASTAAAQATTATSVLTSAASSATSYLGSEVAIARIKPTQLAESDEIAIALMNAQGWNMFLTSAALKVAGTESNGWLKDLHASALNLEKLVAESTKNNIEKAQLLDDFVQDKLVKESALKAELN